MKKEIKGAIDYLKYRADRRASGLGLSVYGPIILMINDSEKIVEELLEDSPCDYKSNLLTFIDYVFYRVVKAKEYDEQIYEDIVWVLSEFNKLENKDTITGDEFIELLKKEK